MITNIILSYYPNSESSSNSKSFGVVSLVFNRPDSDEQYPSEYLVKYSDKVLFRSTIREQAEKYFFGLYMESSKPSKLF